MSEVKQRKQKKKKEDEPPAPPPKDEPTKEEIAIGKWMRNNVPIKKTKFLSHTVEYFTASVAIDKLLDSPWSKPPKEGEEALFTTRESVVEYLETMLRHKFFHRARKIVVPESELKSKKKKGDKDAGKDSKDKAGDEKTKKKDEAAGTAAESSQAEGDKGEDNKDGKKQKKDGGEKKKRKIRLDMHLQQVFLDSTDAYVWIFEPTPFYYYILGTLAVIATIGFCLFPLWPPSVRQGVYYLSLTAAGFLVFILALAILRVLIFCIVWGLSLGRHHLWLLPNLTEDVGFFASFWPLIKYEYNGPNGNSKKQGGDEGAVAESSSGSKNTTTTAQSGSEENNQNNEHSETESEGSQKSHTGKDFEMVEHDEVES